MRNFVNRYSIAKDTGFNINQSIYNQLKEDICTLKLTPGIKLSEMKIANQYECSRIPVRDALHQLRLENCIESKPQVGSFVSLINTEDLEHVRYVRECLETQVMLDAMKMGYYDSCHEEMQSLINRQAKEYHDGNLELAHQLDNDFHNQFFKLANKEFVQNYMGSNNVHYVRTRFLALKYDPEPGLLIQQHQAILDAIIAKDSAALCVALHTHLNNLYRVINSAPHDIMQYFTVSPVF